RSLLVLSSRPGASATAQVREPSRSPAVPGLMQLRARLVGASTADAVLAETAPRDRASVEGPWPQTPLHRGRPTRLAARLRASPDGRTSKPAPPLHPPSIEWRRPHTRPRRPTEGLPPPGLPAPVRRTRLPSLRDRWDFPRAPGVRSGQAGFARRYRPRVA